MICKNYAKIQLGAVQTDCMQPELCRLSSYVIIKNLELHRKSRNYFNKRERERERLYSETTVTTALIALSTEL